jgi:molybdopterin synthase catalytic subunit
VEVVAPHRAEAFAACQWLIDEMKRVVPIWKRIVAADGKRP